MLKLYQDVDQFYGLSMHIKKTGNKITVYLIMKPHNTRLDDEVKTFNLSEDEFFNLVEDYFYPPTPMADINTKRAVLGDKYRDVRDLLDGYWLVKKRED